MGLHSPPPLSFSVQSQSQSPPPIASVTIADLDKQPHEPPLKSPLHQDAPDAASHTTPSLFQKVLAEFVGTYFLVFVGCGSLMVNKISEGQLGLVGIAVIWGVAVMAMVYATGHVSGAHINPAVTLALAIGNGFPWREVPWYIAAQSLSSIKATFTLKLIFHSHSLVDHVVNRPLKDDHLQSFVIELIITFILTFVISGVGTDTRSVGSMAGLVIGATIAMNVLLAGPISGASMNPARSLGPAIVANSYKDLYVYLLGPSIGAIIGCLAYNNIRLKKQGEISHPAKNLAKSKLFKDLSQMIRSLSFKKT